jgi:hypothetical protein
VLFRILNGISNSTISLGPSQGQARGRSTALRQQGEAQKLGSAALDGSGSVGAALRPGNRLPFGPRRPRLRKGFDGAACPAAGCAREHARSPGNRAQPRAGRAVRAQRAEGGGWRGAGRPATSALLTRQPRTRPGPRRPARSHSQSSAACMHARWGSARGAAGPLRAAAGRAAAVGGRRPPPTLRATYQGPPGEVNSAHGRERHRQAGAGPTQCLGSYAGKTARATRRSFSAQVRRTQLAARARSRGRAGIHEHARGCLDPHHPYRPRLDRGDARRRSAGAGRTWGWLRCHPAFPRLATSTRDDARTAPQRGSSSLCEASCEAERCPPLHAPLDRAKACLHRAGSGFPLLLFCHRRCMPPARRSPLSRLRF